MANSKYEYVKSFEVEYKVPPTALIVILVDEVHHFEKPYDETALNLMNSCATALMEEYPDIVFAYGFSDEFSFVLKKDSMFYQRRISKVLSLVVSFFTSIYTTNWKKFFNLASLLAGTATNPFGDGYYQGPKEAPLEAGTACTGVYGKGAYPGYNANGANGRKYLLPALCDPSTSTCSTLV